MSKTESQGGFVNYYLCKVDFPQRKEQPPYVAECEDIMEALGLNPDEANIFKEIWRTANMRTNGVGKEGNTTRRAAEKLVHYSNRILRREMRAKQKDDKNGCSAQGNEEFSKFFGPTSHEYRFSFAPDNNVILCNSKITPEPAKSICSIDTYNSANPNDPEFGPIVHKKIVSGEFRVGLGGYVFTNFPATIARGYYFNHINKMLGEGHIEKNIADQALYHSLVLQVEPFFSRDYLTHRCPMFMAGEGQFLTYQECKRFAADAMAGRINLSSTSSGLFHLFNWSHSSFTGDELQAIKKRISIMFKHHNEGK